MPGVWQVPVSGVAADLVALHWNRLTAQPERFGQRLESPHNCYGCVAAPTRFVAISDAHQKVAALFQDRISLCIRDRSPFLQYADPIVEAWGRVRVKVLPFGQFLAGEVIEPDGGGLADGKDAADLFWMTHAELEDPDHARWVAEGCRDQVLTLPQVEAHDVGTCIAHARLAWYHRSNAASPSWNVV